MPIHCPHSEGLADSDESDESEEEEDGGCEDDIASDGKEEDVANSHRSALHALLAAGLAREQAELRQFARHHPCPRKAALVEWLMDAVGPGNMDQTEMPLQNVLLACGLQAVALRDFDYDSFYRIWHAAGGDMEKDEFTQVGQTLAATGGIECMRLHYYMLSHAWRGRYFFDKPSKRPLSVLYYHRYLEFVWHGIGDWLA